MSSGAARCAAWSSVPSPPNETMRSAPPGNDALDVTSADFTSARLIGPHLHRRLGAGRHRHRVARGLERCRPRSVDEQRETLHSVANHASSVS